MRNHPRFPSLPFPLTLPLSGFSFQGVPLRFDWVYPSTRCARLPNFGNVFLVQFLFLVSSQLACRESLTQLGVHILWQHCNSYIDPPVLMYFLLGEMKRMRREGEEEKHNFSSPDYLSHLSKSVGLNSFLQADLGAVLLSPPPPPQHLALSALQQ